jgi:hypothetical protein
LKSAISAISEREEFGDSLIAVRSLGVGVESPGAVRVAGDLIRDFALTPN